MITSHFKPVDLMFRIISDKEKITTNVNCCLDTNVHQTSLMKETNHFQRLQLPVLMFVVLRNVAISDLMTPSV